jgi:hypothetical protein
LGSSCSSGNQLYSGGIQQVLNHGAAINVGTNVRVGADLYNSTNTQTLGNSDCLADTETATGNAKVELISSSGSVVASNTPTGTNAWNYLTYTATIPATGVYYIAVISTTNSATLHYQTVSYKSVKGQEPIEECSQTLTSVISAYGYATYLTVASS